MRVKKAIQDIVLWRGLNFLSVFILNVFIARSLGAARAGEWFFFINNLSLLILLLSFSLESGLAFYGARSGDRQKLGLLALGWTAVAALIGFLVFDPLTTLLVPLSGIDSKTAAVCFIAGSLLTSFFSSLFFASEKFVLPNAWVLLVNVVLIAGLITGLISFEDPRWLIFAYLVSFLIQGVLIAVSYFANTEKANQMVMPVTGRELLAYSSTVFIGNLVFFLVYRVDYWFVENYATTEELGNYIQVSRIIQWVLLVPMMISTAIFPLTATNKVSDMTMKIVRLSRLLFWIYLGGCIFAALIGYWLFPWLFGETFTEMYPVFLLHIPGILALASLYPLSSYNAGIKRADINLKGSLLALGVIIVLNIIFTPSYGIYAASVISSIGYVVYFLFSFYQFNKETRLNLSTIFRPAASDYDLLRSTLYRTNENV